MADVNQFKKAISDAKGIKAPTSDPVLGKLYASTFQLPQISQAINAIGATDQTTIANDSIGRQNRIDEIQNRLKEIEDQNDPGKYTRQKKDDGGFAFYDPKGNEISAYKYAKAKGVSTVDALKDSDNLLDQQYTNDYDKLKELTFLVQSNDKEGLDKFYEENPGTREAFGDRTINELWEAFTNSYQTVYFQGGRAPVPDRLRELTAPAQPLGDQRSYWQKFKDLLNPRQ